MKMSDSPISYNGTAPNGGDSCTLLIAVSFAKSSNVQFEFVVFDWGFGLASVYEFRRCVHDSWCRSV